MNALLVLGLLGFENPVGIFIINNPYLCQKIKPMKSQDAVLYIMGMIMIVMILMFLLQLFTSGK